MPIHETTIRLLGGVMVDCEVDFTVTSYGSSPSGYGFDDSYDPGEGPEIEINSVVSKLTGRDYADLLYKTIEEPYQSYRFNEFDYDKVSTFKSEIFGTYWWTNNKMVQIETVPRIGWYSSTALNKIEEEIYSVDDYFIDDGEYYDQD